MLQEIKHNYGKEHDISNISDQSEQTGPFRKAALKRQDDLLKQPTAWGKYSVIHVD